MARSRKARAIKRDAMPHFTSGARVTAPLHSNSQHIVPGTVSGDPISNCGTIREYPGYQRASRRGTGWDSQMNTNTRLFNGGISSYYRSRERGYYSA